MLLPPVRLSELLVPELDSRFLVRSFRMRLGERHGHVHVGGTRREGAFEHRHHEARVDRVQDHIAPVGSGELGDGRGVTRVDARGGEAAVAVAVDDMLGLSFVVIGEYDVLVEITPCRDGRERRADATRPHDQDPHSRRVYRRPERAFRHRRASASGASAPLGNPQTPI